MEQITDNTCIKEDSCLACQSDNILEQVEILTYFQPIISVNKTALVGYETLCRGICKTCNKLIPPLELFASLKTEDEFYQLDLQVREKALDFFKVALSLNSELLLFLNFDANLIEKNIDSPDVVVNLCKNSGVKPSNLVIEITESQPCNLSKLISFVEKAREHGFLIALDDVGTGYSNFDRISAIKPDIIKLDRSIISNIDQDYHKKVIFRSMSRLAGKMGILLLAEGVETENEVLYSLELGTDLLQGFYFSRPTPVNPLAQPSLQIEISQIEKKYREYKIARIKELREKHKNYDIIINNILQELHTKSEQDFDKVLASFSGEYDFIESLYILNKEGIQVTDSHINYNLCKIKPKIYNIFKKGDSHYYREYFYLLQEHVLEKYTTATYFSHVTGGLCRTISMKLNLQNPDSGYVICMNIKE